MNFIPQGTQATGVLIRLLEDLARDQERRPAGDPRTDLLERAVQLTKDSIAANVQDIICVAHQRHADILGSLGRWAEAESLLLRAQEVLGEIRSANLGVYTLARLAEAQANQGKWKDASTTCEVGISRVEEARSRVSAPYLASAYLRSRVKLYSIGARAAYEMKDLGLMLRRADLAKSRWVLRSAASAPAKNVASEFQEVCRQIDAVRAEGRDAPEALLLRRRMLWDEESLRRLGSGPEVPGFSVSSIQQTLSPDEAVLYYFWLDRLTLSIAAITRDAVDAKIQDLDEEERKDLESFAKELLSIKKEFAVRVSEIRNWDGLLLPEELDGLLKGKRRLLLSPHRVLHALPMHALPWREDALLHTFAISYIPNLASLLLPMTEPRSKGVLLTGVTDYRVPGAPHLPSLPQAEPEVNAIRAAYPTGDVTCLQGPLATLEGLRTLEREGRLSEFGCLHFAVHGDNIESDTPLESKLFLRDAVLDGLEIAQWALPSSCVVLSACCSGQRAIAGRGLEELPGDEQFGLTGAFFAAGARRIVSSLWPVDDDVAPGIMKAFHQRYAQGQSPDVALQAAILEHLGSAGVMGRHPFYWAPYFLSAIGRDTPIMKGAASHVG